MSLGYLLKNDDGSVSNLVNIVSSTGSINLKNTGATTLYTVPTGKTLYLLDAIVVSTTSDTIAVGPTVRLGKSTSLTDWLVATPIVNTQLAATTNFASLGNLALGLVHKTFTAGDVIQIDITVGATATTLTTTAYLIGFLI